MMKKGLLFLLVISLMLISGCASIEDNQLESPKPDAQENYQKPSTSSQGYGLGALCNSEEECISFCQNNRGRCEAYCKGNENELCNIIFPAVEPMAEKQPQTNPTPPVVFTHRIFDPKLVSHITPLGELNGGYEEMQTIAGVMVNLKPEAFEGGKKIEVRAPTDMTLESFAYFRSPNDGQLSWALIFRISPEVTLKFDHITGATQPIIDATTSTPKDNSAEEYPKTKLSLKAGDLIAFTSGTLNAHNWNIYLTDTLQKNNFVNNGRYSSSRVGQKLLTARCPFDFYADEMKSEFLNLMGYSKAGESQTCGSVSRDVAGTLSGMWHFSPDSVATIAEQMDGLYASPLSVIKNSAGEVTIDRIDNKRLDIAANEKTNKDPAQIADEHCYQSTQGYAYFKIISENSMRFFYSQTGDCPSTFPESGSQTYYR